MKLISLAIIVAGISCGCAAGTPSTSKQVLPPNQSEQSVGIYRSRAPYCDSTNHFLSSGRAATFSVPSVPDTGNFGGSFYHSAIAGNKFKNQTGFESCSFNVLSLPVPSGFQPDWFGLWSVCAGSQCNSFTFGPGEGNEISRSSSWRTDVMYYVYVYTVSGKQLIESYSAGSAILPTKKGESPYLEFPSPFENGFVYPANDRIGLEIVHAQ